MSLTIGKVINVASVPKLSPFRFPGGKTWLVPYIRLWLTHITPPPRILIEPFAGGASVSLAAIFEKLVDSAILVELDDDIASVWQTVLGPNAVSFAETLLSFELTPQTLQKAMSSVPSCLEERALYTLLKNRTRYGGILAPGSALMKSGENGRGIFSRWYPQTLRKRVLAIAGKRDKITFIQGDGVEFIERASKYRNTVFFIDPPYTVAGRRLYRRSEIDHERLFVATSKLHGDFLMTYDDAQEIRQLARRLCFDVTSIPMQSTKHETKMELLIGRNLHWLRTTSTLQSIQDPLFKDLKANGDSRSQPLYSPL